jgi:hypothetical protein
MTQEAPKVPGWKSLRHSMMAPFLMTMNDEPYYPWPLARQS